VVYNTVTGSLMEKKLPTYQGKKEKEKKKITKKTYPPTRNSNKKKLPTFHK
jgi:hypothetical protein